ncbi:hypothetical protein GQ53DRAFT_830489 [Thozetella sp. PMI_491]|nr:hypothetical protein GQ53DRAFT_830489 [Thozetella sp. PMI_491]
MAQVVPLKLGQKAKCNVCFDFEYSNWPGEFRVDFNAFEDACSRKCPFCDLLLRLVVEAAGHGSRQQIDSIELSKDASSPYVLVTWGQIIPCITLDLYNPSSRNHRGVPSNAEGPLPSKEAFRPVNPNPRSAECWDLAKTWFNECKSTRTKCAVNDSAPARPTRLLKISAGADAITCCIVLGNSVAAEYAALSHCWGWNRCLPWQELPQSYKDAITDSHEDWERESARMHTVYLNADFVIGATRATDSACGFLHMRYVPYTREMTLSDPQRGSSEAVVHVAEHVQHYESYIWEGPLSWRRWAYQERLVARRFLSWTNQELHWECDSTWRCECGTGDLTNSAGHPFDIRYSLRNTSADELFAMWREVIVDRYTTRDLTFELDRLPALSAIASMFQRRLNSDYLAGLWKGDLLNELHWSVTDGPDSNPHALPLEYTAPSWSWASLNARCHYYEAYSDDSIHWTPISQVVDVACVVNSLDPFGRVSGGHLTLRGPVAEAWIQVSGESNAYGGNLTLHLGDDSGLTDVSRFIADCTLARVETFDLFGNSVSSAARSRRQSVPDNDLNPYDNVFTWDQRTSGLWAPMSTVAENHVRMWCIHLWKGEDLSCALVLGKLAASEKGKELDYFVRLGVSKTSDEEHQKLFSSASNVTVTII